MVDFSQFSTQCAALKYTKKGPWEKYIEIKILFIFLTESQRCYNYNTMIVMTLQKHDIDLMDNCPTNFTFQFPLPYFSSFGVLCN